MFAIFPELIRAAKAGQIEQLALLVHRYHGSGEPLRLRPEWECLLADVGIALHYDRLERHGALLVKDEKGTPFPAILLPQAMDWVEQKFLLAHLLGHFFLDYQAKIAAGTQRTSGLRELHSPYERYLQARHDLHARDARTELQADAFAAAFLTPKSWLQELSQKEKEPQRIAEHFNVSIAFLTRRLVKMQTAQRKPNTANKNA
ncbi:MAG: ImmA/IrrE family metallo-endopeptidase [Deltaproteobacteria bacterium]|nr:ImmA/IrrE family metallo-endopeptidase [Deltaproteobacteria bacterium]